jgi:hypothetical protein
LSRISSTCLLMVQNTWRRMTRERKLCRSGSSSSKSIITLPDSRVYGCHLVHQATLDRDNTPKLTCRYAHMLNLIGPSSQLHFTSLSQSSIPPLQKYLETTTPSSSSKAHLHTDPILTLVEKLGSTSAKVCLLDPRAPKELAPEDGETFDIFLYGGILGMSYRIL